jgi:Protein of unknown function (DUF1670)
MSKPTTQGKQARRLGQKGLQQQICERFENDYGFDKGRRVIPIIVADILSLVGEYYGPGCGQGPDQIVFTAVHKDAKLTRGKTMAHTRQQAVRLTMYTPDDCDAYAQGSAVLCTQRFVRWLDEAPAQGGLLTTADLAFLSGVSCGTVERLLRQHEQVTGKLVPLRGTVHDASGKISHKATIVALYRDGHLPTEIARMTDHSLEAVEHYLRDFELVRELWPRYDVPQLSRLIGRGPRVVRQYVALLQQQPAKEEGGTPVRKPSVSPLSGSHEPAEETVAQPS